MNITDKESNIVNGYQEIWESRSSIRTRPRHIIDFTKEGVFFPENKQPLLLNEKVNILDEEIKKLILLQSFQKYLHDIVYLEINLVNSACNKIIYNDLVINYTDEIKLNAYTVIIDEVYHAYIAKDIIMQLNRQYANLADINYYEPDSFNAVSSIKKLLPNRYHDIFEIIAVCIFETTLVKELVEFFHNENIHPSVKKYINDHMNDEAKHNIFFNDLLRYTWHKLPLDYQENIGNLLANFIKYYLDISSERKFNFTLINAILADEKKSEIVIEETYRGFRTSPDMPIVKNVLNILKNTEILQNKYVKSSFQNIGWEI